MATRTENIDANTTVNLTTLFVLEEGVSYVVEVGASARGEDCIIIAYDADPETAGGHLLAHGSGRFITQGPDDWFARFDSDVYTSTSVVCTEADVCGD